MKPKIQTLRGLAGQADRCRSGTRAPIAEKGKRMTEAISSGETSPTATGAAPRGPAGGAAAPASARSRNCRAQGQPRMLPGRWRSSPPTRSRRSTTPRCACSRKSAWISCCPRPATCCRKAGAEVDGERVRFDREHDRGSAGHRRRRSSRFHARNPANTIRDRRRLDGLRHRSAARPTAPISEGGRRTGNHADYRNFLKLAQYFNCIDFISRLSGRADRRPCLDPPSRSAARHGGPHRQAVPRLFAGQASASATASRSPASPAASSHEQLEREPSLFTIVNTNSPLKLDTPMLRGIIEMSSRNQIICVTPFTLAGAMAPVTVAGAVVEQNAEALAGLAFTQMVRKGAPVHLWRLHLQCRHEVGRARLRHAGIHEGLHRRRPAGAALQRALPHLQHLCRQYRRCAGRL